MVLSDGSTVLFPVDVSTDEPSDRAILDLLRPVNVVVLGYYPVPQQTAPAHSKAEHETDAAARLQSIATAFEQTDHAVESVLVFTQDRDESIDRIADQHDCDAVVVAGEVEAIERVLVPLRGDVNLERIVSLVGDLVGSSDATVTFFHSVTDGADPSQGEFVLRGAADRLAEEGVDPDRIDWRLADAESAHAEIVDVAAEFDLVVLGETKPSLTERIIGSVLTPIVDEVTQPAIIVRDVT